MATFSTNTLTEKGQALIATALATEQALEFTGLAIGDGAAPDKPETLTDLVNKVMDVEISKVYKAASEPGTSIFRASFQNKTGAAFYFREAGIYARLAGTSDAPILYGYTNAGDTADLIDTVEEGSLLMQTLLCNIVTGSADVQLIDNPSALITRQDLLEYLPLTGGTMTGYIVLDPNGGTKNNYNIGFDFDAGNGAGLALRSKNREGDPGSWVLYAKNGDTVRTLVGRTDGTMTWDGGAFICTEANIQFRRNNTEGCITFHGGTNTENGSGVFLYGEECSGVYKGDFLLRAAANGQIVDLRGQPNGSLTWGAYDVLTSAGGVLTGVLTNRAYSHPVIGSQGYDEAGNLVAGATLYMFPANEPTYLGGFVLRAVKEDGSYVELCGKNDGTLSWNNADIQLVGEMKWYAGTAVPTGYLLCDGSAVSRTTYARLFAAIGTTWGAGDESSTFNLPNLIDRVAWGGRTAGAYKAAGLPNITGTFSIDINTYEYYEGATGAFTCAQGGKQGASGDGSVSTNFTFNASLCNSIYGASNTVQPPAATLMPIIKY